MIITIARKPLDGTVVNTVLQHNCGALNIDASRIGTGTGEVKTLDHRSGNYGQDTQAYAERAKLTITRVDQGRWPANVFCMPESASLLDQQTALLKAGTAVRHNGVQGAQGASLTGMGAKSIGTPDLGYGDSGGASRFFKQIKED